MKMQNIKIGTSGWSYNNWIGKFYPEDIKHKDLLAFYAQNFNTVEINNTFYNLPSKKTVDNWIKNTPDDFVFSCKASRYITHMKKLKTPEQGLKKLFDFLEYLKGKLGPILFQLPSKWQFNAERLNKFLLLLPGNYQYAFEFRDKSWLCDESYGLLAKHNCALCFYDYKGYQPPEEITADFVYIRLHGPEKQVYTGSYSNQLLSKYADKIKKWNDDGKKIYCYFDNDEKAFAPIDARELIKKIVE